MPRLSEAERNEAIGMLRNCTINHVAAYFNTSRKTIRFLQRRANQTGTVKDRPRVGRPRKTTNGDDRAMQISHLRNRFKTASETARNFRVPISRQTVSRRLSAYGLKSRRPVKRAYLTARHRQARFNWARIHRRWTLRMWQDVVFSDESRYYLAKHDGRLRVYRRPGERFQNCTVNEASDRRSVMVWGAISTTGRSQLVIIRNNLNGQRYVNNILQPHLIPFLNTHNNVMTFQQDNARPHTAQVTTQFLNQNNINILPWPSMSADMNPIEHLWDRIEVDIRRQNRRFTRIDEMENALLQAWQAVPQRDLRTLCLSMRRRCTACFNAIGGHTKY